MSSECRRLNREIRREAQAVWRPLEAQILYVVRVLVPLVLIGWLAPVANHFGHVNQLWCIAELLALYVTILGLSGPTYRANRGAPMLRRFHGVLVSEEPEFNYYEVLEDLVKVTGWQQDPLFEGLVVLCQEDTLDGLSGLVVARRAGRCGISFEGQRLFEARLERIREIAAELKARHHARQRQARAARKAEMMKEALDRSVSARRALADHQLREWEKELQTTTEDLGRISTLILSVWGQTQDAIEQAKREEAMAVFIGQLSHRLRTAD